MSDDAPLIFFSYATPDRDRVIPYFDFLLSRGVNVWIDFKRLVAGQDWDREIKRSLEKSTMIVIFLSENSVDRRGYVQRELRASLDKLKEKLLDDIFVIPVLLDNIPSIPSDVAVLQCVKTWIGDPFKQIDESIRHQLTTLGAQVQQLQESSQVLWSTQVIRESWDGLPGYEADIRLLSLSSSKYPEIQGISDLIKGKFIDQLMKLRQVKLFQDPDNYSFGQERYSRCHTLDAGFSDPVISGRMLTIQSSSFWFTLGAHGYTTFSTEMFTLDPVTRVGLISSIFHDPDGALTTIQTIVRTTLLNSESDENGEACTDESWVINGTSSWDSFCHAILKNDRIEFIFPQYQVDCYAAGVKSASVKYIDIFQFIKRFYLMSLDILHLNYKSQLKIK